uniref:Uncharacterized protein n=1 Tax=Branchiostoma floridae TaxID=7739 RepID=C3Z2G4_BRAFL|eukprot:XP_002597203.1 hypothetical protein BRAFLDRAFT_118119 [Branchiostoma floridae]
MVTVISCNFARVAIKESRSFTSDKQDRYAQYKAQFQGREDFEVKYLNFCKYADKIDHVFTHWAKTKHSHERDDMQKYVTQFSPKAWDQLSEEQKGTHQLQGEKDGKKVQCKGCYIGCRDMSELFNGRLKDRTTRAFFATNPTQHGEHSVKGDINAAAKKVKQSIEQVWREQSNDVIVHLDIRESDGKYEERRMALNFETREGAKKRARERAANTIHKIDVTIKVIKYFIYNTNTM